jgi:hypothetical protein
MAQHVCQQSLGSIRREFVDDVDDMGYPNSH